MSFYDLKNKVCQGNKELVEKGLVLFTWGNLSAFDPDLKVVAIKPSGVDYSSLKPEDIPILDLDGNKIEGNLNPSSDTKSHLEIYKNFEGVFSVIHTHSTYATIFAQAKRKIPCLGTTHADYFYGEVPLIPDLTENETKADYERNTGRKIVNYYKKNQLNPQYNVACLCSSHGPFVWGETITKAVYHATVLEQVAKMAFQTLSLNPTVQEIPSYLLDKHFLRKHGKTSYYGQRDRLNEDYHTSR